VTPLRFDLLATLAWAEDLLVGPLPLCLRWASASCGLLCKSWMASCSLAHLASSLAVISLFWASVSDEFRQAHPVTEHPDRHSRGTAW